MVGNVSEYKRLGTLLLCLVESSEDPVLDCVGRV